MTSQKPTRDELADEYLDQLPFEPYPFQEEALLAWFSAEQGVLVCAPTGMGKTLIAEAAMYEALRTGRTAYYTTPLIALTEQKFRELQSSAERWGFRRTDVGLVTGNRRENPDATCLVVVAEILANRLLHGEEFDFSGVSAVVMDEFHSFADPERGMVWELSLGLLPSHVRTLLLSATVGNAREFVNWLRTAHQRRVELVEGHERRVPLIFQWVPDQLLTEHLEWMAEGDEEARATPALVFCFNREECWRVAEQIKGKKLLAAGQQAALAEALKHYDLSGGAGPKLRQLLLRGVGVHHAGVLPKYKRVVEELFQAKLLAIAACTETLAAGINLPARSVVLPSIIKGPPGKKRIIDPSSAHQMFGRAGRPQYDKQGYVFALAHEDDVKIARWKVKYDQIPEDTKDPQLIKARKALKRKAPSRNSNEQYWTEAQFQKLCAAPPGKLASRGPVPWRLLAYTLAASPEIDRVRTLVKKRLTDSKGMEKGLEHLEQMLLVLWRAGYVELEPAPPRRDHQSGEDGDGEGAAEHGPAASLARRATSTQSEAESPESARAPARASPAQKAPGAFGAGLFDEAPEIVAQAEAASAEQAAEGSPDKTPPPPASEPAPSQPPAALGARRPEPPPPEEQTPYRPERAYPTPAMRDLLLLRGINPLYGVFLVNQLGIASRQERIQALESVLELPRSLGPAIRVPGHDELPPGPLATTRLDVQLLQLGLALPEELVPPTPEEEPRRRRTYDEEPKRLLTLADKLKLLFDYDLPGVHDLYVNPVWVAGELLALGGDFEKYVTSHRLQNQEGMVFRHLLRLILLVGEFTQFCPPDITEEDWRGDLEDIASQLTETCRAVDPSSTERALEEAEQAGGGEEP